MTQNPEAGTHTCNRCCAIVPEYLARHHYEWHAEVEPALEKPTTDFGMWDDGKWSSNSRNWG